MRFSRFTNISPLDFRYVDAGVRVHLSEERFIECKLHMEKALAEVFRRRGLIPVEISGEIDRACAQVTAGEVYEERSRIGHEMRALVNCIRSRISDDAKPFVHLTATSQDISDSARVLQYGLASYAILIPEFVQLEKILIAVAEREAETVQIGRTHGQHAVPITFGFCIAGYVSRLGECIVRLKQLVRELKGKCSGAVGAYNASSLLFDDPEAFEREVLAVWEIEPAEHSTQIVSPEPLLRFFHEVMLAVGIMADLADDMRHLQRTEIREVREAFGSEQVGSSTMPQKQNPDRFERVKSIRRIIVGRMVTAQLDQLSEHQRDGTGFASGRTDPEILAYAIVAAIELARAMHTLEVNRERCAENINLTHGLVAAEPLYILLASLGHPNAHEKVRQLTLVAERGQETFQKVVSKDMELRPYLKKLKPQHRRLLKDPSRYTGISVQKTRAITARWKKIMEELDTK